MSPHLLPLLDKLADHRVLCVGDVMLDKFVYGQVDRISPEAPIPVLHVQRETMTLGGAGNVVRNLVSLGGQVDIVGIIGADAGGEELSRLFGTLPHVTSRLLADKDRPTTIKTRYVAEGQQLLRADHEIKHPPSAALEDKILHQVREALADCVLVILSDYAKGVLTDRVVNDIIAMSRAANKPVLVDPKGRDFGRYRGATLLTPNRRELTEATGKTVRTLEDAEAAARQLIAAHGVDGVLAKLGGDGVCLVLKDQPALPFRTTAREVYDVSGAGDTVMAALALALAGGLSPADSAALANIAGSVVVGKIGTAVVTRAELAQEFRHDQTRSSDEKILSLAQSADRAERWRKQGLKVGFTNGVFDLLHPGHLALIRQARTQCDKLIVGMNSDASVKRLKGESRPVQNETARAAVLASLADVDGVVIFTEDTPLTLIQTIRPALLVKGADYTLDKVVGGDLVQSWGGHVVLAQLVDGQSTTATIARLKS